MRPTQHAEPPFTCPQDSGYSSSSTPSVWTTNRARPARACPTKRPPQSTRSHPPKHTEPLRPRAGTSNGLSLAPSSEISYPPPWHSLQGVLKCHSQRVGLAWATAAWRGLTSRSWGLPSRMMWQSGGRGTHSQALPLCPDLLLVAPLAK